MTVEQLKIEAKKLGYNIIKKQPYIKLEKCRCGKKPGVYHIRGYVVCRCNNCKTEGPYASTERYARLNWNKMEKNYDK